jgi:hypothetical protein
MVSVRIVASLWKCIPQRSGRKTTEDAGIKSESYIRGYEKLEKLQVIWVGRKSDLYTTIMVRRLLESWPGTSMEIRGPTVFVFWNELIETDAVPVLAHQPELSPNSSDGLGPLSPLDRATYRIRRDLPIYIWVSSCFHPPAATLPGPFPLSRFETSIDALQRAVAQSEYLMGLWILMWMIHPGASWVLVWNPDHKFIIWTIRASNIKQALSWMMCTHG